MDKKNIAIVTGASSGFGKEFVKLLINDINIDEIFVLSRSGEKLEALKNELGEKIKPYVIDLSEAENIKTFGEYLKAQNPNVRILVNNAGYAKFCSYDDISIEESLNMINLNISGVVAMGLTCIPYMEHGSHILNIASLAGFQPVPYMNIYSATKSFVKNYSRALNIELKDKGITVTAVCPGWMKTNLYERGCIGSKKGIKKFFGMVSPEIVAKKALKDAYDNKDISIFGMHTKLCTLITRFLPDKVIMKCWLLHQGIK